MSNLCVLCVSVVDCFSPQRHRGHRETRSRRKRDGKGECWRLEDLQSRSQVPRDGTLPEVQSQHAPIFFLEAWVDPTGARWNCESELVTVPQESWWRLWAL
jgi:hypothetical protein